MRLDRDNATRVIMVVPFYPQPVTGGLEKQAHELTRSLVAQGHSVIALAVRFSPAHTAYEVVDGIPVIRLKWSGNKLIRFIATGLGLARVLIRKRNDYDVVHIHQHSWFGLSAVLVARLLGKPCLIKLPNIGDFGIPGMSRMPLGWLRIRLFRLADGVVSMSEQSGRELDAIEYPRERVFWTSNGIDLPPSAHVPTRSGTESDPIKVVFVGRLMAQKGVSLLLRAWRIVVGDNARLCRLEIWGDGPLESSLKAERDALGLADSVVFSGHVENVRNALRSVSVFVLPSLHEGNSNALLEAMAAGLPCVASRVGGTPMLVGEEGAPWLCDAGDIEGLAERLGHLIDDAAVRDKVGDAMRSRVEQYFDIRRVAASYGTAYRALRDGRRDRLSSCLATWPRAGSPAVAGGTPLSPGRK